MDSYKVKLLYDWRQQTTQAHASGCAPRLSTPWHPPSPLLPRPSPSLLSKLHPPHTTTLTSTLIQIPKNIYLSHDLCPTDPTWPISHKQPHTAKPLKKSTTKILQNLTQMAPKLHQIEPSTCMHSTASELRNWKVNSTSPPLDRHMHCPNCKNGIRLLTNLRTGIWMNTRPVIRWGLIRSAQIHVGWGACCVCVEKWRGVGWAIEGAKVAVWGVGGRESRLLSARAQGGAYSLTHTWYLGLGYEAPRWGLGGRGPGWVRAHPPGPARPSRTRQAGATCWWG
jgi:hypothetical protein